MVNVNHTTMECAWSRVAPILQNLPMVNVPNIDLERAWSRVAPILLYLPMVNVSNIDLERVLSRVAPTLQNLPMVNVVHTTVERVLSRVAPNLPYLPMVNVNHTTMERVLSRVAPILQNLPMVNVSNIDLERVLSRVVPILLYLPMVNVVHTTMERVLSRVAPILQNLPMVNVVHTTVERVLSRVAPILQNLPMVNVSNIDLERVLSRVVPILLYLPMVNVVHTTMERVLSRVAPILQNLPMVNVVHTTVERVLSRVAPILQNLPMVNVSNIDLERVLSRVVPILLYLPMIKSFMTVRLRSGLVTLCFIAGAASFQLQNLLSLRSRRSYLPASASTSTLVDFDQDTPRDVATMEEWATYYGVQKADGVRLVNSQEGIDDGDVCLVTTQDLPTNSPVLFVPNDLIFSSTAARQELCNDSVQQAEELLGRYKMDRYLPEFALYLKLITQVELGDESPWFPWFNALPRTFYNGASMTDLCFDCLPPLAASVAREERSKNTYFRTALNRVDFISDTVKNNNELTTWAFQVVCTRSFESDGDRRIVPMADMFNHGTETDVVLSFDDQGNSYAYATRDVPSGSPLRMSYGDPTNPSKLFAVYGFLDETSPATFCKYLIPQPTRQLVNMGYDHSQMLFFNTGDVSEQVYDILLYQILDREDRDAQQALYEAHMRGDVDTKYAIHQHFADKTMAALNKHVDQFLRQLDELSAKAEGKDITEHPRLPLILRHNEFVKETFLRVKSRLAQVSV